MQRPSVLLVDDEPLVIRFLSRCLDKMGYDVTSCGDGSVALSSIKQQDYDVLLTDIHMPTNGLSLIDWVCRNRPSTHIVVITGIGSPGLRQVSLNKGAVDYLEKPVDVAALRRVLDRGQHEREAMELLEYIQLLLVTDRHALLRVVSDGSERCALIFVDDGCIVHAATDGLEGVEAFYRCATTPGSFCSLPWCAPERRSIEQSAGRLLLEAAKRRPESVSVRLQSKAPETRTYRPLRPTIEV